jgi:hypothetical protein
MAESRLSYLTIAGSETTYASPLAHVPQNILALHQAVKAVSELLA